MTNCGSAEAPYLENGTGDLFNLCIYNLPCLYTLLLEILKQFVYLDFVILAII